MPAMPMALWRLWLAAAVALLLYGLVSGERQVAVVLLFATGMAALVAKYWRRPGGLRRERRAKGLCERCGYDLRGNVSGVCPECGRGVQ